MILEPNVIVLYVDNVAKSSSFYQDLLGLQPGETSPTFHSFPLSSGMILGLKAKHTVEPPAERNGGSELAFTLSSNNAVDELFTQWQKKEIHIALPPTTVPFGYTFVALDPDGNRLRAVSLGRS